jgi:hypothetical protein
MVLVATRRSLPACGNRPELEFGSKRGDGRETKTQLAWIPIQKKKSNKLIVRNQTQACIEC